VADAACELLPCELVKAPAAIVLTYDPVADAVTDTFTVQVPLLGGMVPPVSATVLPPAAAVAVPPQVVITLEGLAIVTPLGNESVNVAADAAAPPLLPSVIVNVEVPVAVMVVGEKPLLTETAAKAAELERLRKIATSTCSGRFEELKEIFIHELPLES
jgi:hypothetical protein